MATGLEPHPLLPLLSDEQRRTWPAEEVAQFDALRAETMEQALFDPLRYGYELPIWKKADEAIEGLRRRFPTGVLLQLSLGGNRASKTDYMSKRIVQAMIRNPGMKCWALQSNQTSSRQNQQSVIYKYLPPEWKPSSGRMRGGPVTKIVYSQAGGFTEDVLVAPNKSECRFKFYGMDVGSVEGSELLMAWCDELVTLDWIEMLIFRLVTRNGTLHVTFTPIEGYSQTVKAILDGCATIEETIAELLPIMKAPIKDFPVPVLAENPIAEANGSEARESTFGRWERTPDSRGGESLIIGGYEKVPRIQENLNALINGQSLKSTIVYFHTSDNPFGNYASMKETLAGASREKILIRAYGVPSKATGTQFPLFKDNVHVVSQNFWKEVEKQGVTRYCLVDPTPGNKQSGRNWFILWLAIDRNGRRFWYREWPSHGHADAYVPGVGDMGPWAVSGKADDGEKGPAQTSMGWSLTRYRDEILRMEGGEEIFERWMDSRYGNAPQQAKERSTTLIDEMENELNMRFLAAPGDDISEGIDLINNKLYYDVRQDVSSMNQPLMYVVETCPNLIFALKNWTGKDGGHGATKDPIDLLRYAETGKLGYVDRNLLVVRQPWLESNLRR